MPEEYFVDAWFFIALTDRRDTHHRQVRLLARRMAGTRLTTHDGIFFEVLAYFSDEGPAARTLGDRVHQLEEELRRVERERDILKKALSILSRSG